MSDTEAKDKPAVEDKAIVVLPGQLKEPTQIGEAITKFVTTIRDSKLALMMCMPAVVTAFSKSVDEANENLRKAAEGTADPDPKTQGVALSQLINAVRRARYLSHAALPKVVERSLFIGLFSAYDAFTGDLLSAIFEQRPELYRSIKKKVDFEEVLDAPDLQTLRQRVLHKEISDFRRLNYVEQLADLSDRFDVRLECPAWPQFVEAAQRRNLLTHCDGVVSEQYLSECKKVGLKANDLAKHGTTIGLGPPYVFQVCEVLIEIGAKLGQTLWRKVIPDQISEADNQLNTSLLYESLASEQWPRARMFGEFATRLPRYSSEESRLTFLINHAQALKWSGNEAEARALLRGEDWSACDRKFSLAVAVLNDEVAQAAVLMRELGKTGMKEFFYRIWPLFRVFRTTPEFQAAYEAIYGYSFQEKAREDAAAAVKGDVLEGAVVDPNAVEEAKDPDE